MPFAIEICELRNDQTALGRILIGSFCERFELITSYWSTLDYQEHWQNALHYLISHRQSAVALMTWMAPVSVEAIRRAWILYRENDRVFVQERVFIPGEHPATFDNNEMMVNLRPRETRDEEGNKISEWETSVAAIKGFLAAK